MAVDHQELRKREVEPENEVLSRHIVYSGPLSEGLLKHTADETWQTVLDQVAEGAAGADSSFHLSNWREDGFPNIDAGAKSMLTKIMNLDPAKKATIDYILADPYWG